MEVAGARSTARFPGCRPVFARMALCLVALIFSLVLITAWGGSATAQSVPPPDSVTRRPLARSEQERTDFNTAYALTGAAREEAAAIDFSNKYPTSELRRYLYSSAMLQYQKENNPAKMLAMSERVLALDPDNPLALVLTATVLADSLGDRDRDKDKKTSTIKHNASRAIQAAEAGYSDPSGGAAPYKTTLQSWKYTMPAFLVPFMFVLDPAGLGLLLMGSFKKLAAAPWGDIAVVSVTAMVGIAALAAGVQNWLFKRTTVLERWLLIAAGLALVYPKPMLDYIGGALIVIAIVLQKMRKEPVHAAA